MSTALGIVASLRTDIENYGTIPMVYLRSRLDALERAIVSGKPEAPAGSQMAEAVLALAGFGNAGPIQVGHTLAPERDAIRASGLGSARLAMLKHAGLAFSPRHGRWELTEAGRNEAARLQAAKVMA